MNQKIILFVVFALLLIASTATAAPSGMAIYDGYRQQETAMETRFKSLTMTLAVEEPGVTREASLYKKEKKQRMEAVVKTSNNPMQGKPGDRMVLIDDGITSTVFSPQFGKMSLPSELKADDEKRPVSVTLLGEETVEGLSCYKIRVQYPYDNEQTLWIAIKEKVLVKEKSDGDVTLNSDFKKIKGFLVPHTFKTFEDERLVSTSRVTRVKIGARIDADLFDVSKVKGYDKAPGTPGAPMDAANQNMAQLMQMGMEFQRLMQEGKMDEAMALQKKLEAMSSALEAQGQ